MYALSKAANVMFLRQKVLSIHYFSVDAFLRKIEAAFLHKEKVTIPSLWFGHAFVVIGEKKEKKNIQFCTIVDFRFKRDVIFQNSLILKRVANFFSFHFYCMKSCSNKKLAKNQKTTVLDNLIWIWIYDFFCILNYLILFVYLQ